MANYIIEDGKVFRQTEFLGTVWTDEVTDEKEVAEILKLESEMNEALDAMYREGEADADLL